MRYTKIHIDRFFEKVKKTNTCWIWTASTTKGYGSLKVMQKTTYSHRFSYEIHKGVIPQGFQIDHLCKNILCVNPDHLEAVTQRENLMRGNTIASINAAKSHCIRGHIFDEKNTFTPKAGHRKCRKCHADREKNRRFKLKTHGVGPDPL